MERKRFGFDRTNFKRSKVNISEKILKEIKESGKCKNFYIDDDYILINGECIEVMDALISKGIIFDHIITDIPYGTVQGLSIEGWKNNGSIPNWDCPINNDDLFRCCFDISKANANVLLFAQEPMTNSLMNASFEFQKFSLSNKIVWVKNNHANGFNAKTTPLNYYEEILLFRKTLDENNSIALRSYFKKMSEFIPDSKKEIMAKLGQGLDHCFRYTNRTFYIPTLKNYNALIETYGIDKMDGFIKWDILKEMWDSENEPIFNIPDGQKIVKNVFEFKKDTNNIHPTQKPIALLEYMVELFSNEGETILDFTSGSGSTGIAANKKKRKFVGIELDDKFYELAIKWHEEEKNKLF